MFSTHRAARALDVAIPLGVLIGGVSGLIIANQIWPTAQAFRNHGWEPGLILIVCIAAVGSGIYALLVTLGRR